MTILPMKELKDTAGISAKCHSTDEPIHITKNGYSDLVIMSAETFERYDLAMKQAAQRELERKRELNETVDDIRESFEDIKTGRTKNAFVALGDTRAKYGL